MQVILGDRLVATSPSQVAAQWETPRPAKKRHDCLPVTAQQQQQRDADEECDHRRPTDRRSTVLSDNDIWNGGEVDQVDNVQVNIFVDSVHLRGLVESGEELRAPLRGVGGEKWGEEKNLVLCVHHQQRKPRCWLTRNHRRRHRHHLRLPHNPLPLSVRC